jgi:ribosome maturation factor RimP
MPVAVVATELLALVERTVEGLGYELVDLERAAGGLLRVLLSRL